ncbi:MAG: hypothetical protein LBO67_03790 [Spirochaetaceae bacterium]|jgi:hypothetical protein|nr:hypothetical protein [Spirochaetaceae bacterium]
MRKHPVIFLLILFFALYTVCSCSSGRTVTEVLGSIGLSSQVPLFLDSKAVSATKLNFQFSLPVKVLTVNVEPNYAVESVKEGEIIEVNFVEALPEGERLIVDVVVEDDQKNTLNVVVPIRARNDQIPAFTITEVRTEYSKPKVEFIEIKTKSSGNLGALRLFAAVHSMEKPLFEFPPVEVSAGEYIVVHLRSLEEGLVNETGADRNAAKGTEALDDVRDFWVPGKTKALRKTDAIFFMDQNNKIIDAVLLSETAGTSWAKAQMNTAAELFAQQGAWLGSGGYGKIPIPNDALISKSTTTTRSICRDETKSDTNRAADWYITKSSNATPGKANSIKRYEQ